MLGDARGIGKLIVGVVRVGGTRENLIDDQSCAGTASLRCGQVLQCGMSVSWIILTQDDCLVNRHGQLVKGGDFASLREYLIQQ